MSATSRIMLPMALLLSFASLGRSFQVLYVGPPRTGTQTMYTALTILGLRPLHSGYNRSVREPMCNFLYFNGSKKVALNLLNGFDAAMDEPFQLMYDAVMEEFPNAKFILPVTTAEQWMNSYNDFFENSKFPKERRVAAAAQKRLKIKRNTTLEYFDRQQEAKSNSWTTPRTYCWACHYWGCNFGKIQGMSEEENRTCYNNFNAHMERVKSTIPPSRLLLFDFADGWAPLSHFLGRPIPEEPFPFTDKFSEAGDNDSEDGENEAEEDEASASSFLQQSLETYPRKEL